MTRTEQQSIERIERRRAREPWGLCALLGGLTFLVFSRLLFDQFVNYGDPFYLTNNPHVLAGLSWPGVVWAFQPAGDGAWMPLTWISYMTDVQLFGVSPAGSHLVNVLLHAANGILLFLALNRMTGAMWRSGIVAIIFAFHPTHVETVAWVSERKDLLGAFFLFLTLYAYAVYASRPNFGAYLVALLAFALGLMSSPLIVTLPFVLLLLDPWPLRRTFGRAKLSKDRHKRRIDKAARFPAYPVARLWLEKLPFIALSFAVCALTLWARRQGPSAAEAEPLPIGQRASHAVVSYVHYILMLVFPRDLAVFYPRPEHESRLWIWAAALILLVITWTALALARRRPYVFSGWFWFLGTLLPVIGLVWPGDEAWADRYTYLPFIGLFMVIAWSSADLARRYPVVKGIASVVAIAPMIATCIQIGFWKDTNTLFQHALDVDPKNYVALAQLGKLKDSQGRPDLAAQFYSTSLTCRQSDTQAARVRVLLGGALEKQGKSGDAQKEYAAAVKLNPDFEQAHLSLGASLVREKKYGQAALEYKAALKINPASVVAQTSLAKLNQPGTDDGQSALH